MGKLIEALKIFLKYGNPELPTNCKHGMLYVNIDPEKVNSDDIKILNKLDFFPSDELNCFYSYKYGSC